MPYARASTGRASSIAKPGATSIPILPPQPRWPAACTASVTDADVYALPPGAVPELPHTLAEAIERLAEGRVARRWLGEDFVDHYLEMLRAELRAQARSVTDWEIARYADAL